MENHSAKLAQNQQLDGSSAKTAWRSMDSAPRDGHGFLGIVAPYRAVRLGCICADGEHFRADDGCLYMVSEMIAWAPIPDWTGEVAE